MVIVERWEGKRAKLVGASVIAYGEFQPSGISEMDHEFQRIWLSRFAYVTRIMFKLEYFLTRLIYDQFMFLSQEYLDVT